MSRLMRKVPTNWQDDPEERHVSPTAFCAVCVIFAEVRYDGVVTKEVAAAALDLLDVDSMGLDRNDRRILETIIHNFSGGPVGLETLAATIGEDSGTIEDVIEPYLVMNGLIMRTPKGRVATIWHISSWDWKNKGIVL